MGFLEFPLIIHRDLKPGINIIRYKNCQSMSEIPGSFFYIKKIQGKVYSEK